jgi:hypothetical protein
MKTQTYEEAVRKTVEFWIEKSFRTPNNQNNGDNSSMGVFTWALMNRAAMDAQTEITEENIERFREKLTELLMEEMDKEYRRELDVDYSPCKRLSDAARYAGIREQCFPCKTWSRIEADNTAKASYQYRGELKEL